MTVREIVADWLKAHGYDGLWRDGCSCQSDDLMPCDWLNGEDNADCEPGYKTPCDPATCSADGDCPWHIGPKEEAR